MILQFDVGNSSVKWRTLEDGSVTARGMFDAEQPVAEALSVQMAQISEVQVSSVRSDAATEGFIGALHKLGARDITVAQSQAEQAGLTCAYAVPGQMGVDRWLALLGAWQCIRRPLVVVDAGSAVTIDVVGKDGMHEGGFILPGRRLQLGSLQSGTSRVLFDPVDDPIAEPGRDTQACVSRGLSLLWRGLAGQVQVIAAERDISDIWLTGGDAAHLQSAGLTAHYVQDLVLDGLFVYCNNSPGKSGD